MFECENYYKVKHSNYIYIEVHISLIVLIEVHTSLIVRFLGLVFIKFYGERVES